MSRLARSGLAVGFCSLAAGVLVAHANPPSGYELSIYVGTPMWFWIGTAIAGVISLVVLFFSRANDRLAIGLFGFTVATTVMLPVLRGYHFLGEGDSLTHLGFARMIVRDVLTPAELFYPGIHLLSIAISFVAGTDLTTALMLMPFVAATAFFLFVPLFCRRFYGFGRPVLFGTVSAALLLPINWASVHMHPHPVSQAILFSSVVLYCIVLYLREPRFAHAGLVAVAFPGVLLIHPQQALVLILVLAGAVVVQFHRRVFTSRPTPSMHLAVVPTLLAGFVFWAWVNSAEHFASGVQSYVLPLLIDRQIAEPVDSRGISLSQLGTGLDELFLKLFAVTLVYFVLAAVIALVALLQSSARAESRPGSTLPESSREITLYLFVGMVPVLAATVLTLVGSISTQSFRYLGAAALVGTLLGSACLSYAWDRPALGGKPASILACLLVVVFLVASVPIYHPSPYVFQPNQQVTEAHFDGYETTFAHVDPDRPIQHVRSPADRYADALVGIGHRDGGVFDLSGSGQVADHFDGRRWGQTADGDRYLAITDADRLRDPVMYRGFRYGHEDFQYLDSSPAVNHVQSNGGYDLYQANGTEG